ncbi:hypothetical protein [Veillonella sp.]|uniref:hypothetical protein n=3 Tax=Veillonellaceae TaxID=31977 RepID=UPI0025E17BF1|nr:hypothetical protein [Veillonella sp.]
MEADIMDHTTTPAMIAAMYLTRAKECMDGEINDAFDLIHAIIVVQAHRGMPWAYVNVPEDIEAEELYSALGAIAGAGFRVQRVEVFNPEAFNTPVFKIEW